VVTDYSKDRRLCFTLALGISSLAAYTAYQTSQPKVSRQARGHVARARGSENNI